MRRGGWLLAIAASSCAAPPATSPGDAAPPADGWAVPDAAPVPVPDAPPPPDAATGPDAAMCGRAVVGSACGGCGAVVCVDGQAVCTTDSSCRFTEPLHAIPFGSGFLQLGSGVALGDIDANGTLDAMVGSPEGVFVVLNEGGVLSTVGLVPDLDLPVTAVSLVDFDDDSDLDLAFTYHGDNPGVGLWENDGTGIFADASFRLENPALPRPYGVAWGDYDGDGDLDLFVAGHLGSRMYRSEGGETFTDVTAELGVELDDHHAFQPVWFDYDEDGDQDLLVTIDLGTTFGQPQVLFRNDGAGAFTHVSLEAGLIEQFFGMGVAVGDIDDDGDFDAIIGNIGEVGGQPFYVNNGDGTFTESSLAWGTTPSSRWVWGAELFDYDNDTDLDLVLASKEQPSYFGVNLGNVFADATTMALPADFGPHYGHATGDFDGDGRLDLVFVMHLPPVAARFHRNIADAPGHWLRVELHGASPNRGAVGAKVGVRLGDRWLRRLRTAGASYLSQSDPVLHFGLGDATVVDELAVTWPDGTTTVVPGPLSVDRTLSVTQ